MKLTPHLAAGLLALAISAAAALVLRGHSETAPDVIYTRLDGTPAQLSQLRGKVVLVSFWATTCAVCVKEMPQLVATHRRFHPRGYETLAVAMRHDPPASVVHFAQSRQLPFTVVIDNTGNVASSFGDVAATPTSLLINRRGEIVARHVGELDFSALNAQLDALLDET